MQRALRHLVAIVVVLAGSAPALSCRSTTAESPEDPIPLPERSFDVDASDASDGEAGTRDRRDGSIEADAARPLLVFASSVLATANLGGLAGADAKCASLAAAAGLGGQWVAWLSVEDGPHAIDRVTSPGPWHLPTGERVASNKTDLVSGILQHAIDRDEKGAAIVLPLRVWTGTGRDGRYSTNDCDKWTNGNDGRVGLSNAKSVEWTTDDVVGCKNQARIYCFER